MGGPAAGPRIRRAAGGAGTGSRPSDGRRGDGNDRSGVDLIEIRQPGEQEDLRRRLPAPPCSTWIAAIASCSRGSAGATARSARQASMAASCRPAARWSAASARYRSAGPRKVPAVEERVGDGAEDGGVMGRRGLSSGAGSASAGSVEASPAGPARPRARRPGASGPEDGVRPPRGSGAPGRAPRQPAGPRRARGGVRSAVRRRAGGNGIRRARAPAGPRRTHR